MVVVGGEDLPLLAAQMMIIPLKFFCAKRLPPLKIANLQSPPLTIPFPQISTDISSHPKMAAFALLWIIICTIHRCLRFSEI